MLERQERAADFFSRAFYTLFSKKETVRIASRKI
jgi:3-phenylpropionate/cinnamic acid dioxygenase small subunit